MGRQELANANAFDLVVVVHTCNPDLYGEKILLKVFAQKLKTNIISQQQGVSFCTVGLQSIANL